MMFMTKKPGTSQLDIFSISLLNTCVRHNAI